MLFMGSQHMRASRVGGAQCSRAQDIQPVGADTYWPKAPSTFALVAPQVEEAVVIYLEDADNQYSFEVVRK